MTYLVFVYNEARRIRPVLDHATQWATDIVVVDKGSTDGTLDIIREYGTAVRVISIPFCDRGHEDMTLLPQYANEDWIFMSTCSEVPTRKLIEACKEAIATRGDQLDLIYVPRLMFFFGQHRSFDNGGVCYYPFLLHRNRTTITNQIHDNFQPHDPARTFRIPFAEDRCVYHLTHPSVRSFWLSTLSYFDVEMQKDTPPEKVIRDCFKNVDKLAQNALREGENWLPFYCALACYELGKALTAWEKAQGGPQRGAEIYQQIAQQVVAREWSEAGKSAAPHDFKPVPVAGVSGLKKLLLPMAKFPYLLTKFTLKFNRAKKRR
jgi:hypothetical protein